MNPLIITIIIATAAFIVSLFGASWLNQRSNAQQTETLRQLMEAQTRLLDARLEAVHVELRSLTARVDRLERTTEERFSRIERQLDAIFKPAISKTGD